MGDFLLNFYNNWQKALGGCMVVMATIQERFINSNILDTLKEKSNTPPSLKFESVKHNENEKFMMSLLSCNYDVIIFTFAKANP